MKTELLDIIKHKYNSSPELSGILKYSEELIDACELQREFTKDKFKEFLSKYNYRTINQFSEYPDYPTVTLYKGVDYWTLSPIIGYGESGLTDTDEEIGEIFSNPEIYPDDDNEDLLYVWWGLIPEIVVTWLSIIWFEIDGPSCGLVVNTLENNSCKRFIFTDLAWDELSLYYGYNNKDESIPPFFETTPDLLTIFTRVAMDFCYPYKNRWRFFRKGNEVKEIVIYGNETGEKDAGKPLADLSIIEHKSLLDTLNYELSRTMAFNKQGFKEFLQPKECATPIYEGAIETLFCSGQHYYDEELNNRIPLPKLEALEAKYDIVLPFHFKHYLRLFNGRKYNKWKMSFFIGNSEYLVVKEFFDFSEIEKIVDKTFSKNIFQKFFKKDEIKEEWIPIGTTENEDYLMLNLNSSLVGVGNRKCVTSIFSVDFEQFIKAPK